MSHKNKKISATKILTAGLFTMILVMQCAFVTATQAQSQQAQADRMGEAIREAQNQAEAQGQADQAEEARQGQAAGDAAGDAAYEAQKPGRPPVIPEGSEEDLLLPHAPSGVKIEQAFFETRLPMLTQFVVSITGAVSFLFIVIGGVRLLTAYGSEEKIEHGKKTVIYAIVGLLISILSYAIVSIISAIEITQAATLPETPAVLLAQSGAVNRNTDIEDQRPPTEDVTYGGQSSPEATGHLLPGRVVPANNKDSKTQYVSNLPDPKWEEIIAGAIRIILNVTGSLTLIAMTAAGIYMILAQGDEDKIHKGKEMILWSLVALVIIAISYALVVGLTQLQFFQ